MFFYLTAAHTPGRPDRSAAAPVGGCGRLPGSWLSVCGSGGEGNRKGRGVTSSIAPNVECNSSFVKRSSCRWLALRFAETDTYNARQNSIASTQMHMHTHARTHPPAAATAPPRVGRKSGTVRPAPHTSPHPSAASERRQSLWSWAAGQSATGRLCPAAVA